MLRVRIHEFANNEAGGGTIMGLLWFALLVGITGMAVDVTDGLRNRTMLQATADATSLAAAIDLPNDAAAVATAVAYSVDNMGAEINGSVLDPADVRVGLWDPVTQALDTTSATPDAVMVTVRRAAENANPLPANFLRIMGLQTWNVRAQAVAQRFIPGCLRDGLVAREMVDMSSNNGFVNQICIHGNEGVNIQSNNYFETGVNVSMPSMSMLELPNSGMTSNIGLREALRENYLDPRMVNHVDEIMVDMVAMQDYVMPDYIHTDGICVGFNCDSGNKQVIEVDEKFDLGTALPGRIYHVICKPNKVARIPNNSAIANVIIIAECEIHIGSGATIFSSVIGSRSGGNGKISKANIVISANVQLGKPDNCNPGGGVQLFSNATIHTAASTSIDGVQLVAAGDIDLGARDMGINGISAQSGGTITLTSNNMFGLCSGGAPNLFTVDYYRLVL
jgi:Flp pilus assembly protein TadG